MLASTLKNLKWLMVLVVLPVWAMDVSVDNLASNVGKVPFEAYRLSPQAASLVPTPYPPTDNTEPFYVFRAPNSALNRYAPSGWMGDYEDLFIAYAHSPQGGSIKITYLPRGSQGNNWAGIYWQHPANNWGGHNGGFNLLGMHRLTFWARGEEGGEVIGVFKVGGIRGIYADSDEGQIGPIVLSKEWQRYTIDLQGMDMSHVIGGFAWATGRFDNPGPITFYLSEIRYEP